MRSLFILMAVMLLAGGCVLSAAPLILAGSAPLPTPMTGDAERGAEIFRRGVNGSPPCSTCHQVVKGAFGFSLGPNLDGIGARAGTRVDGLDTESYLRQSILDPHRYVVPGYRDIMYPEFSRHFTDQDMADLIAYLLTL